MYLSMKNNLIELIVITHIYALILNKYRDNEYKN